MVDFRVEGMCSTSLVIKSFEKAKSILVRTLFRNST